jgi:NADP-dependent 3-hydroxy acid dehydrogenase YdfG
MTGDSGRLLQGRSHMSKRFVGKLAVVTGGSTGMGLATARRFVQEGIDHIFITGRGQGALDAAAAEMGKNVTAVLGDVSNLADLVSTAIPASVNIVP